MYVYTGDSHWDAHWTAVYRGIAKFVGRQHSTCYKWDDGMRLFPGVSSLVTQMVKNLPSMKQTRVQSLGREDPLEMGMATHSSILAWRIPWTEEAGGLQPMGS